jgi:hypothetical protein
MKTNSLKFRDERVAKNGEQWIITIELNDECKNGHQDFSITGECYLPNRKKTERNLIHCGACGDEIAVLFPEYEIFNSLHLCDYKGIPMHCISNGFYFLKNGFDSRTTGEKFINEYCQYYRLSRAQFNTISVAESQTHFAILLVECGILEQWEKEAKKAIKKLEELTGDEFLIDSVKTQYNEPKQEEIIAEKEKIANGYYSNEQKTKREEEKKQQKFDKINKEEQKAIDKIKLEYQIKRLMLSAGDEVFENYIFYSHSNEIKFNWRDYGKQLSTDEINEVKNKIGHLLPNGITLK